MPTKKCTTIEVMVHFGYKTNGKKKKLVAQRGARTHDPEIKSLMLYRLS